MSNLKSLKISECQNFADSVIEKAKNINHDEFLDALFHLALYGVYAMCTPDTDIETRRVLALYQVQEAINNPKVDAAKIFKLEKEQTEETIIQ